MARFLAMAVLAFATLPAAAATYHNIPIESVANDSLATYYHEVQPVGDLLLGGVPFHIGTTGLNVFQSEANGYGTGKPTSAHLDMNISTARYAHVLLAGTSVHLSYAGATMGSVTLRYGDGSYQRFDLVVGDSVRDWVAVDGVVVSTSSPMVQTVWQGTSEAYWGYREAIVSMLSIPLQPSCQLVSFDIEDTSAITMGNLEPGLFFYGLTIESSPVPEPSAVLALLCGMGGVSGMVMKRRSS